jgi:hypothetical protein
LTVLISANKTKIFYGLLKEPDINIPADDEDEGGGDGEDKPKVISSVMINGTLFH